MQIEWIKKPLAEKYITALEISSIARTISGDDGSRAMCATSSSDLRVRED